MSQEALALEAGFDRTYISLVERGIQSPTVRNLVKLAAALQVRASEIVVRMEAALEHPRKQPPRRKPSR